MSLVDFTCYLDQREAQLVYHLGNMLVSNDERLCQQNVITVSAVTRSRRRIAYQACLKSGQLEPRRNPQLGIKRCFFHRQRRSQCPETNRTRECRQYAGSDQIVRKGPSGALRSSLRRTKPGFQFPAYSKRPAMHI